MSAHSSPAKSECTDVDDSVFQDFAAPKIISIEGNIGSGKTTLLSHVRDILQNKNLNQKIIFLKEPVDVWETIKDDDGKTMLEKFYADQEKYSFAFQMMAYISRLQLLRDSIKANPGAIIITERSLYTDKMVFAKMLFEQGKIESVQYQIYLKWFHHFADECPLHSVIYVKTDPDICHERVFKRSRTGEDCIPLEYLQECHKYHENMLCTTSPDCVCRDQLVLNGNLDCYENQDNLQYFINEVKKFIGVQEMQ